MSDNTIMGPCNAPTVSSNPAKIPPRYNVTGSLLDGLPCEPLGSRLKRLADVRPSDAFERYVLEGRVRQGDRPTLPQQVRRQVRARAEPRIIRAHPTHRAQRPVAVAANRLAPDEAVVCPVSAYWTD